MMMMMTSLLSVWRFPILLHFLQTIWYCPCTWSGLFFSSDLWSSYQPVHLQNMWLSGIITITNSNGDSTSPWKISLWIFTSFKFFSFYCQFDSPVLQGIFDKLNDLMPDILYILNSLLSSFAGLYHMPFCSQSTPSLVFVVSFCCPWECLDQYIVGLLYLWSSRGILSNPQGTVCSLLENCKSLPKFVPLVFFT